MNDKLNDWYELNYSDGKRIKLQELWVELGTGNAKGRAMSKIKATIDFIKTKRPESSFELFEYEQSNRGPDGRHVPGVRGWIDAIETLPSKSRN
jgi:hypothetical protein